jgi:hypothetical protein
MLLQMAFEKLGKAALLRSGGMTVVKAQSTHQAATAMMQTIGASRRACARFGFSREYLRRVLTPMVEQLESLNPALVRSRGGAGPWLEYPWEDPLGDVRWPARDLPGLESFRPRHARKAVRLFEVARSLLDRFDEVFA